MSGKYVAFTLYEVKITEFAAMPSINILSASLDLMTTLTIYVATPGASDQLPALQGSHLSPVSAVDNERQAVNRPCCQ